VTAKNEDQAIQVAIQVMPRVISVLQKDHQNVMILLQLLDPVTSKLTPGTPADFVPVLDVMNYMTRYSDLFHHPMEELVFKKIVERDDSAGPLVATLTHEHKTLGEKGGQLLHDVRNVVNGFEPHGSGLAPQCRDYVSRLRKHMSREETDLFPLASALLNDKDWGVIERGLVARADPLFGAGREVEYAALYEHIVSAARR
jgi:hemerythrin-like domain-containing protein